jgi:hypothetical protein
MIGFLGDLVGQLEVGVAHVGAARVVAAAEEDPGPHLVGHVRAEEQKAKREGQMLDFKGHVFMCFSKLSSLQNTSLSILAKDLAHAL